MIDTHTHLYAEEFTEDIADVIARAQEKGITQMLLPAIDSSSHNAMLQLEQQYPTLCTAMMGLHPCYVKEDYQKELIIVEQYLNQRDFIAIGEIGLDFYWDTSFSHEQLQAFNIQMQWALERQKPIVIHSRNAMQETINAVRPFAAKGLKGIFHCFSGDLAEAQQIISMNFMLGIGGPITYKKNTLPEIIQQVPLENIVLETDAPYLAPVPYRGKRNESSYLTHVADKLAECYNTNIDNILQVTTDNARRIFNL